MSSRFNSKMIVKQVTLRTKIDLQKTRNGAIFCQPAELISQTYWAGPLGLFMKGLHS